jgi:aminomethyltransferase
MGRVYFKGRHARKLMERLVTRRVSDMQQGQCRYALCLNEHGGVKDDVLVYRLDDDHFLLVVNASNRLKLLEHFEAVRAADDLSVKVEDKTEKTAMMAMQGPKAMDFISKMSKEVPTLKRYRFVEKNILVMKLLVSRTGYTGEDGVEVIVPASAISLAMKMFQKEAAGAEDMMKPCGLGARDTLRLEAGMALYGHELSEDTNALATGLGFAMNLDKADDERGEPFVGMEALRKTQADGGPRQTLVGLTLDSRRTARQGMVVMQGDDAVGEVTSGCASPTLNQSIAMAYVNKELAEVGTTLEIDLGKDRRASATVTPMPFYKAPK